MYGGLDPTGSDLATLRSAAVRNIQFTIQARARRLKHLDGDGDDDRNPTTTSGVP